MAHMTRKRMVKAVRVLLPFLILMTIVSTISQSTYGSICVLTIGPITLSCPLGFAQTSLASHGLIMGLLIPAIIVIGATVLLGRFFCGWICPAGPLMQGLENISHHQTTSERFKRFAQQNGARIALLASMLLASAVLRYPVFCIVCPVGIIYRNAISFTEYGSIGIDLIFIPLLVALEMVLAPWCSRICPLGTLLTIFSRKNPIVPSVNKAKCTSCLICTRVCKMGVALLSGRNLESCSKCLDCSLQCPTKAIEWRKRTQT
jgi:ferredoxin-type protein NapH